MPRRFMSSRGQPKADEVEFNPNRSEIHGFRGGMACAHVPDTDRDAVELPFFVGGSDAFHIVDQLCG